MDVHVGVRGPSDFVRVHFVCGFCSWTLFVICVRDLCLWFLFVDSCVDFVRGFCSGLLLER